MEQIDRIQYFEAILDKAEAVTKDLSDALENYRNLQDKIKELEAYYDSPVWMKDYRDDEEGKIPVDLKRGVLSEDAVYNILEDNRRLREEMKNMLKTKNSNKKEPKM